MTKHQRQRSQKLRKLALSNLLQKHFCYPLPSVATFRQYKASFLKEYP